MDGVKIYKVWIIETNDSKATISRDVMSHEKEMVIIGDQPIAHE